MDGIAKIALQDAILLANAACLSSRRLKNNMMLIFNMMERPALPCALACTISQRTSLSLLVPNVRCFK